MHELEQPCRVNEAVSLLLFAVNHFDWHWLVWSLNYLTLKLTVAQYVDRGFYCGDLSRGLIRHMCSSKCWGLWWCVTRKQVQRERRRSLTKRGNTWRLEVYDLNSCRINLAPCTESPRSWTSEMEQALPQQHFSNTVILEVKQQVLTLFVRQCF